MTREYPARPIVGVGAVVYVTRDEAPALGMGDLAGAGVVLIKRRFPPLAGEWSLPGGTLEVGETLESATAREVLEETGILVHVGPVIEVFDRIMRDADGRVQYHFVLVDYLCRATGGTLRHGSDADAAVLADVDALDPYGLTEKTRAVIHRGVTLTRSP